MEELLQKLIAKVYELNKTTRHDLFLDFSGHTNQISIYCYENGWGSEKELIYVGPSALYLDNEKTAKKEIENLLQELDKLEK